MSATLELTYTTAIYLTDRYYSGSFSLDQNTESLFIDKFYDTLYLDSNTTSFSASAAFVLPVLSTLQSSADSTLSFGAVFGNVGRLGFAQETSISLTADVAIFGRFDSTVETDFVFNNTGITASFSFDSATLSSLSGFLGITGFFDLDVSNLILFNGGAYSTSTDIGNILSYKIVSVMNLNTTGMSEYTNYNFNSFFSVGNKYYGCCSDGVFLLEGDLDNASSIAQSVIKTATTDFGTQKLKSVRDAYAYVRSSGDMFVSLVTNEQVDRSDYPLYYDGVDGVHRRRVKTAQGIRGTTWGTSIKNDTNVDFTVKQLDVIPKELERSI